MLGLDSPWKGNKWGRGRSLQGEWEKRGSRRGVMGVRSGQGSGFEGVSAGVVKGEEQRRSNEFKDGEGSGGKSVGAREVRDKGRGKEGEISGHKIFVGESSHQVPAPIPFGRLILGALLSHFLHFVFVSMET